MNLSILMFEEVLRLRPEEPQSHRDLALAPARRVEAMPGVAGQWPSQSHDDLPYRA